MTAGWSFSESRLVTGFDLIETWGMEIEELVREGLACKDSERFYLTRRGLRFADAVAEKFIHVEPSRRQAGKTAPDQLTARLQPAGQS